MGAVATQTVVIDAETDNLDREMEESIRTLVQMQKTIAAFDETVSTSGTGLDNLGDNFGRVRTQGNRARRGFDGMGSALKSTNRTTGKSSQLFQQLGYIINDAQVATLGWDRAAIALSNNISPLLTSLGLSAGTLGVLTVGLNAAATAFVLLSNKTRDQKTELKELKGSIDDVISGYVEVGEFTVDAQAISVERARELAKEFENQHAQAVRLLDPLTVLREVEKDIGQQLDIQRGTRGELRKFLLDNNFTIAQAISLLETQKKEAGGLKEEFKEKLHIEEARLRVEKRLAAAGITFKRTQKDQTEETIRTMLATQTWARALGHVKRGYELLKLPKFETLPNQILPEIGVGPLGHHRKNALGQDAIAINQQALRQTTKMRGTIAELNAQVTGTASAAAYVGAAIREHMTGRMMEFSEHVGFAIADTLTGFQSWHDLLLEISDALRGVIHQMIRAAAQAAILSTIANLIPGLGLTKSFTSNFVGALGFRQAAPVASSAQPSLALQGAQFSGGGLSGRSTVQLQGEFRMRGNDMVLVIDQTRKLQGS